MNLVHCRKVIEQRKQQLVERTERQFGLVFQCGDAEHRAAGPLGDLHRSIEQGSLPNSGIPGDQKHRRIEFSRACCEGGERFQFGIPPEEHAYQPITVSARSPSTRT